MVWIKNTKTDECFRVDKNKLEEYIEKGFEKGRIFSHCAVV